MILKSMEKKIEKYIVIGDIHGRTNWKKLVDETFDEKNMYIFVGDYTDPYYYEENVSFGQMLEQIKEIFTFKMNHPDNVVLLIGNHDLQYIIHQGDTNRYETNQLRIKTLEDVFEENKDLITGIAYSIGNKYLITHAGLTRPWFDMHFNSDVNVNDLGVLCDKINTLYKEMPYKFTFECCVHSASCDYYGTSSTHSPVWVRPETLYRNNPFNEKSGVIQIVGHTRLYTFDDISGKMGVYTNDGKWVAYSGQDLNNIRIITVDCLASETACLMIDMETLDIFKYYVS